MIWIELIVCAVLIFWVGSLLSKYGDVIAEKTGLGTRLDWRHFDRRRHIVT